MSGQTGPLILAGSVSEAVRHLDRLGWALAQVGLATRTRYEEAVPLLYAFDASLPLVGESIRAVPACRGANAPEWWFVDSMTEPVAPCSDVANAVERIITILAPVLAIVGKSSLSQDNGARLGQRPLTWLSVPRSE
ncbi:hypothetical protein [Spirillospora sp. NPDC047279]|uniref:hypothetical protein n=1 Tax=Spirillospora sp. NPDC047279 TaxID=3155478 RepID=UPI0033E66764